MQGNTAACGECRSATVRTHADYRPRLNPFRR